jgi:hypothetical protein
LRALSHRAARLFVNRPDQSVTDGRDPRILHPSYTVVPRIFELPRDALNVDAGIDRQLPDVRRLASHPC